MPSTWWTEDRTETLRKLWSIGVSFSRIAAELGEGVTRNAVCGKIHRMEFTGPGTYRKLTDEQLKAAKRKRNEIGNARRRERRREQPIIIKPKLTVTNLEALRCVEVKPLGKTLLELGPDECRYPFGDGPFTFCGHPTMEGHSYCGPHFGLSARRGQS
jgi:GcrA cell cycle regulator